MYIIRFTLRGIPDTMKLGNQAAFLVALRIMEASPYYVVIDYSTPN